MTQKQWNRNKDNYSPGYQGVPQLEPGAYRVLANMNGIFLQRVPLYTDDLLLLAEGSAARVIEGVRRFWSCADRFKALGLIHKRGVLFHGMPGCGKSASISLLAQDVISSGGIAMVESRPDHSQAGIKMIREVEPDRPLLMVMEDLDTWLTSGGHESILSNLLDGNEQVGSVVYAATTNHIDRIPGRFKNRPSRFDEVVAVGMPVEEDRLQYLTMKTRGLVDDAQLRDWASKTKGLTLAHLRELIVGVVALGQPFESVLGRLSAMSADPGRPPRRQPTTAVEVLEQAMKQAQACTRGSL